MAKYTITYFDIEALGEPIRLLLAYGNVDFTDNRIDYEKDWMKFKAAMPMGQLPILEVDGHVMYQSLAISRFLAKKFELVGNDDHENYEIDNAVDNINDLRARLAAAHYETNPDAKEEKYEKLRSETLPFMLGKLDEIAADNNGFLALKKFTWADIYFTGLINYLNYMAEKEITAEYPNLKNVVENTSVAPGIKEWIAIRPKSDR